MKKVFLILLLPVILIACKSNSNPSPLPSSSTVKYVYSSATKGTYEIEYTGSDGNPVDTTYTGTSFVKTIITARSSGFKVAHFTLTYTAPTLGEEVYGGMSIYVGDEQGPSVISDVHFPNTYNNTPYTLSCSASVFN